MAALMKSAIAAAVANHHLTCIVVALLARIRPFASADPANDLVLTGAEGAVLVVIKPRSTAGVESTIA